MKNPILLITILLLCISCRVNQNPSLRDNKLSLIGDNLYWKIEDFYSTYLRYPDSVEELIENIKHITTESAEKINFRDNETLNFLINNKDKIIFKREGKKFILNYKKKKIIVDRNICLEIKDPINSGLLFKADYWQLFDSSGKLIRELHNKDFCVLYKDLIQKSKENSLRNTDIAFMLFRFNKEKGLYTVCPDDSINMINENIQTEIILRLDTFLTNREIDLIQFIFPYQIVK